MLFNLKIRCLESRHPIINYTTLTNYRGSFLKLPILIYMPTTQDFVSYLDSRSFRWKGTGKVHVSQPYNHI